MLFDFGRKLLYIRYAIYRISLKGGIDLNWNEDNLILTRKLISKRSVSGEEREAVDVLKNFFEESGFDEIIVDKYGSCIGGIIGNKTDSEGLVTLFDGHIDTVPVVEKNWSVDPYNSDVIDGKVYGRGASDMKGALSSMAVAVSKFAKETKKDFSGKIYVSGSVFEEVFEGVAPRSVSKLINPDFVIIGEASELDLKIGQRGRAEIIVETFGRSAHSANPSEGKNAVLEMMKLIERISKIVPPSHDKLGEGILVLTDIISKPYPGSSVIPDYCRVTYDRRLLVDETIDEVLKPIQEIIDNFEIDGKVSISQESKICYTGEEIYSERFFPGWIYDKNEYLIQKSYKGLKNSGLNPDITNYSFCTNGSHYAGEKGIITIGFGPSNEDIAHKDDEYIEIEQLNKALNGYYNILKELYK